MTAKSTDLSSRVNPNTSETGLEEAGNDYDAFALVKGQCEWIESYPSLDEAKADLLELSVGTGELIQVYSGDSLVWSYQAV